MTYYQLNMFDAPALTEYEKCLVRGSGFEGGKVRIFAACSLLKDKEFAVFLKEEYGTGGCSVDGGFLDYGPAGLTISKWKSSEKQYYKWNQVAKDIRKMIGLDLYLTEKEKEKLKIIKDKNEGIYPLPTARYRYGE